MYDIILKRSSHFKLLSEKVGRARSCKAVTTGASPLLPPFMEPISHLILSRAGNKTLYPCPFWQARGDKPSIKVLSKLRSSWGSSCEGSWKRGSWGVLASPSCPPPARWDQGLLRRIQKSWADVALQIRDSSSGNWGRGRPCWDDHVSCHTRPWQVHQVHCHCAGAKECCQSVDLIPSSSRHSTWWVQVQRTRLRCWSQQQRTSPAWLPPPWPARPPRPPPSLSPGNLLLPRRCTACSKASPSTTGLWRNGKSGRCSMLNAECWMLNTESWMLNAGRCSTRQRKEKASHWRACSRTRTTHFRSPMSCYVFYPLFLTKRFHS